MMTFALIAALASSAKDCGDLYGRDVDHVAEAERFRELGDMHCVLVHRELDAENYGDVDSLYNLALAYEDVGAHRKALPTWQKVALLDPDDTSVGPLLRSSFDRQGEQNLTDYNLDPSTWKLPAFVKPSTYGVSHLKLKPVERVKWGSAEALKRIEDGLPTVFYGVEAGKVMKGRWNIEYLSSHLPQEVIIYVFLCAYASSHTSTRLSPFTLATIRTGDCSTETTRARTQASSSSSKTSR